MKKRWGKRALCMIMTMALIIALMPATVFAGPLSQIQIIDQGDIRYYDENQNEISASPQLGANSVVSVEKTVEGTDTENEFIINLDVRTGLDISNVKLSSDAAVVLVLDISDSMKYETQSQGSYITILKQAAINFVNSYAAGANGANRYISLVTFNDDAKIEYGWINVSNDISLQEIKTSLNGLTASGFTFMEGGLLYARNLLRTDGFPTDRNGQPIENRSVILFSDGIANRYLASDNSNQNISGKIIGSSLPTNPSAIYNTVIAERRAEAMAAAIKKGSSVPVDSNPQATYDARLYAIGFGSGAPASWLQEVVATNTSHYYAASGADSLNRVFDAINQSIERWAEAWNVQDPIGSDIEFIQHIAQTDIDTGMLSLEDNMLEWNLKKSSPASFENNIYTFSYCYRIRLDTTSASFVPDMDVAANGPTKLQYAMLEDGHVVGDVLTAEFASPKIRGYQPALDFIKVGDNGTLLAGCEFLLENTTAGKPSYTAVSGPDGKVSFPGVPSGYTYTLTETAIPADLADSYLLNTEARNVTVAMGSVTVDNVPLASGYEFVNKSRKIDFSFTKIDGNLYAQKGKMEKLAGAEFSVFLCSDQVKGTLVPTDVINGTDSSDWILYAKDVKSDKYGDVTLSLEKGSYMLVETKAPFVNGLLTDVYYQLPYGQWSLKVDSAQAQPVEITAVADSSGQLPPAFVQPKDAKDNHKLQNMRVHDLPLTGGPGIILFIGAGALIILIGAVLFIIVQKRSRPAEATARRQS